MSDNMRTVTFGAEHVAVAAPSFGGTQNLAPCGGKHSKSSDIMVHDESLCERIACGHLLAAPAADAYSRSKASNYKAPLPRAVDAVRDGHSPVRTRRYSLDNLLSRNVAATPWIPVPPSSRVATPCITRRMR